jgi:hypothetical protein
MENYLIQEGFERLKIIKPDFIYQKWYFNKIFDSRDIKNKKFYTDKCKSYSIDLFDSKKINGTFHSSYNNLMWIEMLGNLKRFKTHKNSNFEFLLDWINTNGQVKTLKKYGDDYFIRDGNHRFCLAKFLGINLKNIEVCEYEFNEKYFEIYTKLENRNILIEEKFNDLWKLKMNEFNININEKIIMDFIKLYDEIQIKTSIFDCFYLKENKVFISSLSDLKTKMINNLIYLHKKTIGIT